ncbi:hypothetical protein MTO96_023841 [Rhipicephalus appendiculatus]
MIVVATAQGFLNIDVKFQHEEMCTIISWPTGESWQYYDETVIPLNHSCAAFVCLAHERRLELMGCPEVLDDKYERPMDLGEDENLYPGCCQ